MNSAASYRRAGHARRLRYMLKCLERDRGHRLFSSRTLTPSLPPPPVAGRRTSAPGMVRPVHSIDETTSPLARCIRRRLVDRLRAQRRVQVMHQLMLAASYALALAQQAASVITALRVWPSSVMCTGAFRLP